MLETGGGEQHAGYQRESGCRPLTCMQVLSHESCNVMAAYCTVVNGSLLLYLDRAVYRPQCPCPQLHHQGAALQRARRRMQGPQAPPHQHARHEDEQLCTSMTPWNITMLVYHSLDGFSGSWVTNRVVYLHHSTRSYTCPLHEDLYASSARCRHSPTACTVEGLLASSLLSL